MLACRRRVIVEKGIRWRKGSPRGTEERSNQRKGSLNIYLLVANVLPLHSTIADLLALDWSADPASGDWSAEPNATAEKDASGGW
jgi:hypothetical protein